MSKYDEIRKFVQRHHGFVPKTSWIAHVEEIRDLASALAAFGILSSGKARGYRRGRCVICA